MTPVLSVFNALILIRQNVIILEIMEKQALGERKCRRAVMGSAEKVDG